MKCKNCGGPIDASQKQCQYCGTTNSNYKASAAAASWQPSSAAFETNSSAQTKRTPNVGKIVFLAVVIFILIVGASVGFGVGFGKNNGLRKFNNTFAEVKAAKIIKWEETSFAESLYTIEVEGTVRNISKHAVQKLTIEIAIYSNKNQVADVVEQTFYDHVMSGFDFNWYLKIEDVKMPKNQKPGQVVVKNCF